jgi:hypothetical protein
VATVSTWSAVLPTVTTAISRLAIAASALWAAIAPTVISLTFVVSTAASSLWLVQTPIPTGGPITRFAQPATAVWTPLPVGIVYGHIDLIPGRSLKVWAETRRLTVGSEVRSFKVYPEDIDRRYLVVTSERRRLKVYPEARKPGVHYAH